MVSCKNDTPATALASTANENTPSQKQLDLPKKAETLSEETKPTPVEEVEEPSGEARTVTVSSVEEIVENAQSNTIMYLEKGTYELEADMVYFMTKDERRIIDKRVEETRSIGGQLHFNGLDNFQIIGKNGVKIVSKNPQAIPFFMVNGKNLKVSNLTIKKDISSGADLSYFSGCQNIEVERCKFDGGGGYGFYINGVEGMKVNNCQVTKCTSGAVRLNNTKGLTFMNTTFSDNFCKVPVVNFYSSGSSATFDNVTITDNKKNTETNFQNSDRIFAVGNNSISLENCVIANNEGYITLGVSPQNIKNSQIEGVAIQ